MAASKKQSTGSGGARKRKEVYGPKVVPLEATMPSLVCVEQEEGTGFEKVISSAERLKASTRELARQKLDRRAQELNSQNKADFRNADEILIAVRKRFGLSPEGRLAGRRFREQAMLVLKFVESSRAILDYVDGEAASSQDDGDAKPPQALHPGLWQVYLHLHFMSSPHAGSCDNIFAEDYQQMLKSDVEPFVPEDVLNPELNRVVHWSLWGGKQAALFRLVDVACVAILLGYFPSTGESSLGPEQAIDRAASTIGQRQKQILRQRDIQTKGG